MCSLILDTCISFQTVPSISDTRLRFKTPPLPLSVDTVRFQGPIFDFGHNRPISDVSVLYRVVSYKFGHVGPFKESTVGSNTVASVFGR